MKMYNRSSRGQAFVETAVIMPLVILSIVFLFWCGKEAVTAERTEVTTRIAQEILGGSSTFNSYSLLSMYDMIQSNGAHVNTQNGLCQHVGTGNFFSTTFSVLDANNNPVPMQLASLWGDNVINANCINGGVQVSGLSQPTILAFSRQMFTVQSHAPLAGWNLFSSTSTPSITSQLMDFMDSPTMQILVTCVPGIQSSLQPSLVNGAAGVNDPSPTYSFNAGDPLGDAPASTNLGNFNTSTPLCDP